MTLKALTALAAPLPDGRGLGVGPHNMKKIYMQPLTAVVKTTLTTIIASSPNITINSSESVNAANVDAKYSGDWDIWDDDDNE